MADLNSLVIELFKNEKINYDQTIELIKLLKKEDVNNISLKYETSKGSYLKLGIPKELFKINIENVFDKIGSKKEEKKQNDKDELIENILKIMK